MKDSSPRQLAAVAAKALPRAAHRHLAATMIAGHAAAVIVAVMAAEAAVDAGAAAIDTAAVAAEAVIVEEIAAVTEVAIAEAIGIGGDKPQK